MHNSTPYVKEKFFKTRIKNAKSFPVQPCQIELQIFNIHNTILHGCTHNEQNHITLAVYTLKKRKYYFIEPLFLNNHITLKNLYEKKTQRNINF